MESSQNGFEQLRSTDDPDVVALRSEHHAKFVVFAIAGTIGAAVAAAFAQWGMVVLALLLALVSLVVRSQRTLIDRRSRRYGKRYPWSGRGMLPHCLEPGPLALHKRVRRAKGTVEETYDVSVGGEVLARGLYWGDAQKLASELGRFLALPWSE